MERRLDDQGLRKKRDHCNCIVSVSPPLYCYFVVAIIWKLSYTHQIPPGPIPIFCRLFVTSAEAQARGQRRTMASQVGIVSLIEVAEAAHAQLREDSASNFDLAHGPLELLREVLIPIKVSDGEDDLKQTLEFVKLTLLLLKGLLLDWDCAGFPTKLLELPLRKLPKVWPNRCWRLDHPNVPTLAAEVEACILFMDTNVQVFELEPWIWLYACLQALQIALSN